jgi:hypothetical protein
LRCMSLWCIAVEGTGVLVHGQYFLTIMIIFF